MTTCVEQSSRCTRRFSKELASPSGTFDMASSSILKATTSVLTARIQRLEAILVHNDSDNSTENDPTSSLLQRVDKLEAVVKVFHRGAPSSTLCLELNRIKDLVASKCTFEKGFIEELDQHLQSAQRSLDLQLIAAKSERIACSLFFSFNL